jgi:predicted RNA-binding Zn-ribbon protein involved in translation (DUF1610 family)
MPLAYIKCPETGYVVSTNHIVPDEQALKKPINRHIAIPCPYCGKQHIWDDTNGLFLSIADNAPPESFGGR